MSNTYLEKLAEAKNGNAMELAELVGRMTSEDAASEGITSSGGSRSFLKFNGMDGDFSSKELGPIEVGTKMVFNMAEYAKGYVCWKNKKMVHKTLSKMFGGAPLLSFEETQLANPHGPFDDGDGWKEIVSLPGKMFTGGPDMVYEPDSSGGRKAVIALAKNWGENVKFHIDPDGGLMLPVVELNARGFKSEKARRTLWAPEFKIVDWMSQREFSAIADNVSQDYAGDDHVEPEKEKPAKGKEVAPYRKR